MANNLDVVLFILLDIKHVRAFAFQNISVPLLLTTPIFPAWWIYPGMIPILHSPGLIIPGQFGPINRVFVCVFNACSTFTMSCCGIP